MGNDIKKTILEFVGFLLNQEAKQIKKVAKVSYDYSVVLEINKRISNGTYDFKYLFELTNSNDKLVKEVAICYFTYKFSKKLMTHLFTETKDADELMSFINKKMNKDLKSRLCLHLETDKEFIRIIKADKYNSGSLLGDINYSIAMKKSLGKNYVRKINMNKESKINFICNNFKTSKIPEYLDYIFDEKIKNLELDQLILNLRKKEIISKRWQHINTNNCDMQINKLIDSNYVKSFNFVNKCEKTIIFI